MADARKIFIPAVLAPTEPSTRFRVQQPGSPFVYQTSMETFAETLPPPGIPDAPIDKETYGRQGGKWNEVLPVDGGTLTGPLILDGDPVAPLEAATKEYVDNHSGSGGIPEAPMDHLSYGRMDADWTRVLAINGDLLDGGNF
jgi:hypothetical protein